MKKDVIPVVKHLVKEIREAKKSIKDDKKLMSKELSKPAKKAK